MCQRTKWKFSTLSMIHPFKIYVYWLALSIYIRNDKSYLNWCICRTAFFTVHRDAEKEQKMITKNRQTHRTCTGNHLSKITGLKLCGEIHFPNASLEANSPYFPLTGPMNVDLSLLKVDSHKSYNVEARFTSVNYWHVHHLYNSNSESYFLFDDIWTQLIFFLLTE